VKRRTRKPQNKKVRNATAKVYKGIKFRSKLELFTYRKLEDAGIDALYEKKKYVLQEGFRYSATVYEPHKTKGYIPTTTKIRDITYTPDFVDPHGRWIIEVKGFANDVFPVKWKMFKNYLMQQDDPPVLFLPRNQKQVLETIELIKEL
tara:strand:- start:1476 stop:1919 length:444 start_codon:yes stop_codon:yes gene_type:complete